MSTGTTGGNNAPPEGGNVPTGGNDPQDRGNNPPAVAGVNPPPFYLNPAGAMTGILDFTQVECRKYYHKATKKLDSEELFDCSPENMHHFLKLLEYRAQENGWDDYVSGILWIPEDSTDPTSELRYLPKEYGRVSLQQINAFERTYLGTQQRVAQDAYMLFKCLMNSLSKESRMKIEAWENEYIIQTNAGTTSPSGNLLLKVIIRESHLDTNATTQSIRMKLSNLDDHMLKISSDITQFNGYVKLLVRSLLARGQRAEALLTHLFKGYLAASDRSFVKYINDKKDRYEEGEEIDADKLMQLADNKYRLMKEREEWDAPSAEEEKILALQAAVDKLTKTKKSKRKQNDSRNNEKERNPKKRSAKQRGRSQNPPKPGWMNERPPEGELHKPRKWNGSDWWYCHPDTGGKCQGVYRRHKPSQCEGRAFMGRFSNVNKTTEEGKDAKTPEDEKRLKVAEALTTIVNSDSDEQTSDGYET